MDMITSIQNEKVKDWRKLHKRKERQKTKLFIVEGYHLVEEAWKSNWEIVEVIVMDQIDIPSWYTDNNITIVSKQVFQSISTTKSPQGILAVVKMKQTFIQNGKHLLLIDAVQDPGNLGTIIRTADAAGLGGIILGEGTVDAFNEKVIRATQGSLFHIPIKEAKLNHEIKQLKNIGYTIWASSLEQAHHYQHIHVPEKVALLLGNEGSGIKQKYIEQADLSVKIPIYGKAESLNVGVAASILMYYIVQNTYINK
ncbi:TrmH family RNA methyltransferase [Cerasibacillus quisquiliarum]|uniref:Putative tRNA/rRNA methyltransferase YsgA n=1 Tax=Cerasibacillus quisquiliarum TaxID=227865 RepID=A0A511UXW5_9BACI|nr:RNA methyltransferase [Cerasibacillus quisquiliarum]MBB5145683.1 TrmH family RNA methyltransferase [Cerasibacillus quisquiliarum]GEN31477.1 putative tRNA/rRNA methyltransferase YsgA [Cerasibacillus quisquiliarum]